MFGLRHSPRPLPFFHSLFSFFSYTKQKKKGLILTIFLISSHFNFFSFSPFSLSFLLREKRFSFSFLSLWEGEKREKKRRKENSFSFLFFSNFKEKSTCFFSVFLLSFSLFEEGNERGKKRERG
jgi:hypothetical protein